MVRRSILPFRKAQSRSNGACLRGWRSARLRSRLGLAAAAPLHARGVWAERVVRQAPRQQRADGRQALERPRHQQRQGLLEAAKVGQLRWSVVVYPVHWIEPARIVADLKLFVQAKVGEAFFLLVIWRRKHESGLDVANLRRPLIQHRAQPGRACPWRGTRPCARSRFPRASGQRPRCARWAQCGVAVLGVERAGIIIESRSKMRARSWYSHGSFQSQGFLRFALLRAKLGGGRYWAPRRGSE